MESGTVLKLVEKNSPNSDVELAMSRGNFCSTPALVGRLYFALGSASPFAMWSAKAFAFSAGVAVLGLAAIVVDPMTIKL